MYSLLIFLVMIAACAPQAINPAVKYSRSLLARDVDLDIDSGFSDKQRAQIEYGFADAVVLCQAAILAIDDNNDQGNVFLKYFRQEDRALVRAVFSKILGPNDNGNLVLSRIPFKHDLYSEQIEAWFCDDPDLALGFLGWQTFDPLMVICPPVFDNHLFWAIRRRGRREDVNMRSCFDFRDGMITTNMNVLGSAFIHKWTLWEPFLHEPLGIVVESHVYLHRELVTMDKKRAIENAESYAFMAIEAFWTYECNLRFTDNRGS